MDYILTMEDGSSAYLSHHGVKGMKWGVWNAETKAKYGHLPTNGINQETLRKYASAGDKVWKSENAAQQKGLLQPIRKAKASSAQKRFAKAREKLVDEYMNRGSEHDFTKKDRDDLFDAFYKEIPNPKRDPELFVDASDSSRVATAKMYKLNMQSVENNYQISEAKKKGREAVESYIRYGTPADGSAYGRSSREYAARQGVAVKNEVEGRKYRQLQTDMLKSREKLNSYVREHPKETYGTGSKEYNRLLKDDDLKRKKFDSFSNQRRIGRVD